MPIPKSPIYASSRQAWRDIWINTNFERELQTLSYARAQETLQRYVPDLPRDALILEAGCGPAHIVFYLREQGFNAIGFDYAPEALITSHNKFPALPLIVGDVHALPYSANSLGAYLSFGVVEHFEHGPGPALEEAFRVLRSNGVLVITVPHPQIVEALYQIRQKIALTKRYRAAYYERTYSHQELATHVRAAGFINLKVMPISHSYTWYGLHPLFRTKTGYYQSSSLGERMGALSRWLLPWRTAFETLIVARKP